MLEIRLLGRFEVKRDGNILRVPSHPARLLLAYLALKPRQKLPRALVAGKLWPDSDESRARSRLRQEKSKLIQALAADDLISAEDDELDFDPQGACWVDVRVFSPHQQPQSTDELMTALEAYGGDFLPGFYEEWVNQERDRLQNEFSHKLKKLMEQLQVAENWKELRRWSQEYLNKIDRTDEDAFRAFLWACFHLGELTKIKTAYAEFEKLLEQELGLSPSEATRELYAKLIHAQPPKPKSISIAPSETTRIETPFPSSLRLPPFATPFVGREAELEKITQNIADPACRLLNLMGLGGTGKTRLMCEALSVSTQQAHFADGVFFISLVATTTTDQMVVTLADGLGLNFYGKTPPREQLVDYVREKHLLLGLDNLEQVTNSAELLDEILDNAPHVKLLTTSQGRLHLEREWIFDLDGLRYPAADDAPDVLSYDAVKLCMETAKRLMNHRTLTAEELKTVAKLTRLVEGLPLALEMAMAWLRTLSVAQIVTEVERTLNWLVKAEPHIPKRHHSIRAVFEYSWSLLAEDEKRLFTQLAVFQSGFQKEAVERVARAPFALLSSLREKSLVRRAAGERFELHTLLHRFAQDKLYYPTEGKSERPAEVEMRLADYFLEYASLHQADYAQLEPEWENLHAALRAANHNHMWAVVLGLAASLSQAWLASNHLTEAREMYALACEAARALESQLVLAAMLNQWGRACVEQSDYAEAQTHLLEGLQISRAQQDLSGVANALYFLGYRAVETSQWDEAEKFFAECQEIRESLNDTNGLAEVIFERARVHFHADRITECIQLATQALQMQSATGQPNGQIRILRLLANACVEQRFNEPAKETQLLERAWRYCQQALAQCETTQNKDELALVLRSLGSIAKIRDDLDTAQKFVSRSLDLLKNKGNRRDQAIASHELGTIYIKLGQFPLALETTQHTLRMCQLLGDRFGSVYALTSMGDAYLGLGQKNHACQIWQEALAITQQFSTPHPQTALLRQRLLHHLCS